MNRKYGLRIVGIFLLLLAVYLAVAWFGLEPLGYYGTAEEPRFADPWIPRAETILGGGLLYRDVYTTTPPLVNYLLVPPAVAASLFGHRNPWATVSFQVYFSLFNLLAALALLRFERDPVDGYRHARYFLLNPMTFGNSVLRRQDEAILVFFLALVLLFFVHARHWRAAITLGLSLLVKVSGALVLPVAFLRTRDWKYVVVPPVLFALVFAPFVLVAGESASIWDLTRRDTQHPFYFAGISLWALWARWNEGRPLLDLTAQSVIMVLGVSAALVLIALKPRGLFEDLTLLTTTALLLSPKLHCGYFCILVLFMAPLVHRYRMGVFYLLFGLIALVTDIVKWPLEDWANAFRLIAVVYAVLIAAMAWLLRLARRDAAGDHGPLSTGGGVAA
jgi:hypothetical protein